MENIRTENAAVVIFDKLQSFAKNESNRLLRKLSACWLLKSF